MHARAVGFVADTCMYLKAFFTISLKPGGTFEKVYAENNGDFMSLRDASFIFCLLGLLVWIPDMIGVVATLALPPARLPLWLADAFASAFLLPCPSATSAPLFL